MSVFNHLKKIPLESILLAAIAIAIVLRIANLGSREFWYDEVLSLLLSTGQKGLYQHPQATPVVLAHYMPLLNLPTEYGVGDIFKTGGQVLKGLVAEPHPPLFFLEQHLWLRLFGHSEIAMRSLIALFSVGAIGCAYGLGRCLLGHRGGLLLAALLGLNPFYLFHSLNVRMYGSLVFWTLLSSWSLLELISLNTSVRNGENHPQKTLRLKLFWSFILIIAVTAGLLTFYYFAYCFIAFVLLVLWLDRRRWWHYGACLGTSIALTLPWVWWGTRQQLRNADLERFAGSTSWWEASLRHLQEIVQILGIHLVIGDWVSAVPPAIATLAGIGAIAILAVCSVNLWRNQQRRLLGIALLLGLFPLLLMLATDVLKGQFTIGFGWGRSLIFILPGCLLLLAAAIERAAGRWQKPAAIALLLLYLSMSVADFSLRPRWMFHQIAAIIEQAPTQPTLIVMNSPAWGHVLRLAYYLPPQSPVMLLAQKSGNLAPSLEKTLASQPEPYPRVLWLDSARPVWGKPSTGEESNHIKQVLDRHYQLKQTQHLSGTWELDNFTLRLYQRDPL
jgi:uncharacterized membrane protein